MSNSTLLLVLSQKLQNSISNLKSLHWLKITQRIQYKTNHFSTTNLPPFLIFSPYNQLVLPAHLQLSLSKALQIPLGSKFLTDLSTFKRLQALHFGMLYTTLFFLLHVGGFGVLVIERSALLGAPSGPFF